jgi:hypothetical protein
MSDATATPPAPVEQTPRMPKSKEELYRQFATFLNQRVQDTFKPVAERVKTKHGEEIKLRQVFGDTDARDLVVSVWEGFFNLLLQPADDGSYREVSVGIPGGYGSLQLTTAGATTKKTPQGQTVQVHERWRVKYSPGKAVDSKLGQLPPPPPKAAAPATPAPAPEAAAS